VVWYEFRRHASCINVAGNLLAISFRASIWCRFQLAPRVHDCVFTKVKCPKHHLVAVWKNVWRSAWVSPLVGSCGEKKKRWFDSKDQQRKTKSHVLLWILHTPLFQLCEPYLPFATYLRAKLLFLHLHICMDDRDISIYFPNNLLEKYNVYGTSTQVPRDYVSF
jgi:hypothetical protein